MRNDINIFTVTKGNKVLLVRTSLTEFLEDFRLIESNAPHYNTLYKNFAKSNEYEFGDYHFQKFPADKKAESGTKSATQNN
jgi:hypothetical protein